MDVFSVVASVYLTQKLCDLFRPPTTTTTTKTPPTKAAFKVFCQAHLFLVHSDWSRDLMTHPESNQTFASFKFLPLQKVFAPHLAGRLVGFVHVRVPKQTLQTALCFFFFFSFLSFFFFFLHKHKYDRLVSTETKGERDCNFRPM